MKKILCLLVGAMFAITASAQITWNAKAGFGISSCILSEGGEGSKAHFVGKLGAGMEYPLTANFSLMPSAEFAFKGAKFSYNDSQYNYSEKQTIDIYYFQIPVLGAYRFNLTDRLNLVAKAGPYFAFGLAGKIHDKASIDGNSDSASAGVFSDEVGGKRFELGLDFGVDLEFKRFVVGAEYEFGLTPLVKEDGMSARNSAFYVTVGYKF